MSHQDSPQFSVPGIQWRSGTRQLAAGIMRTMEVGLGTETMEVGLGTRQLAAGIMGTMEVGLGTQAGAGRKDGTGRLHQQLQISPGIRESADKLIQVQLKENNTRIALEITLLFITLSHSKRNKKPINNFQS